MNRDEVEGKVTALKGKAMQAVGKMTDDPALIDEGAGDEVAGKVQDVAGRVRRKVGGAIQDVGKAIKK